MIHRRPYRLSPNGEYLPIATITIRAPGASLVKASPIDGLLDTGSTWTYVPRDIAQEQELPSAGEQQVGFLDGRSSTFEARLADIRIFGRDVPRVRVLVRDETEAVIGRDVLRYFTVVFDGQKEWRVEGDCLVPHHPG